MIKVLNVKQNNRSSDYAQFLLDTEINDCKKLDVGVIVVIHGYGSHGKGGVMKDQIHEFLTSVKKQKRIVGFVKGEEWGELNPMVKDMCQKYPELVLHHQVQHLNSGITVVWVL